MRHSRAGRSGAGGGAMSAGWNCLENEKFMRRLHGTP
jgi:hypothetical protein